MSPAPMSFDFSDDQQALRATIRQFAEAEVAPAAEAHDEAGTVPKDLIPQLAELGLFGILVDEEHGGAGMGYVEYVIILEELARVDPSTALTVAAHNSLGTGHIHQCANEEQKRRYLPDLASGRKLAAWGLTEPSSGSARSNSLQPSSLSSSSVSHSRLPSGGSRRGTNRSARSTWRS